MAKKSTQSKAAALRAKLEAQRKSMSSGGITIDNKHFTKMRLRIIPVPDTEETPGVEYWSLFSKEVGERGNGTTSPRSFGLPCPVMDYLDKVHHEGDKEDKEAVRKLVNVTREYWMGVWDRQDMGEPGNRSIKILRAKRTVYEAIIKYMLDTEDEDDVADVTDPVTGRDIRVRKEGTGLETEWGVKVLDPEPIAKDEAELEAYVEEAKQFNVLNHFFKVDLEVLEEMYQLLTGESIPKKYLDKLANSPYTRGDGDGSSEKSGDDDDDGDYDSGDDDDSDDDGSDDEDDSDDSDDSDEDGSDDDDSSDDSDDDSVSIDFGTTRGQFKNGKDTVEGTITGKAEDEDGDMCYLIVEDGDSEPWYVRIEDVTVVEAEEPEEAEPAAKKPAKGKKPAGKKPESAAKKPAASSKDAAKPKTSSQMRKRFGKKAK